MIISASRRTDVPAFYSDWLMNRIEAGHCCVVNPFNANQVSRVPLAPQDVDVIVFWTKNATPLMPRLPELDSRGYRYYFQYTVNGYPAALEPGLPPLDECIQTFRRLSDLIGPERVIWRYDPIIVSDETSEEYHASRFELIAGRLSGATGRVVISVADEYRAAKGRLRRLEIGYRQADPEAPAFGGMMRRLAEVASGAGMEIFSCAEVLDLTPFGIAPGKCVDDAYIRRVFGVEVVGRKDKTQRLECGCVASKDIGAYDTCLHGCAYCYATRSAGAAAKNRENHDPISASLVGSHECDSEENPTGQRSLF
ncbi:MAG: DUF1848 domain-containing protein [Armatimonadetes bacterium]|nr:DUF1848 domain-containing protein [Armatimonadota bacterium]